MASIDKQAVCEAYEDVRSDASETNWAVLGYDGNNIVLDSCGVDFEDFRSKFTDDNRIFGFIRLNIGDELSVRSKFVLITWAGCNMGAIKKAKQGTDKATVRGIIQNIAIEVYADDFEEINEEDLKSELRKAGGANYGTGIRD